MNTFILILPLLIAGAGIAAFLWARKQARKADAEERATIQTASSGGGGGPKEPA